ncbi:lipid II flippase MurJ [Sphingorhabdus sp.]|uniref:lipid II flippase MurJ n=1 Tax=Sphingorhabdus sp. TaxID=1902408 RepID=UPI0035B24DEC
MSSRHNAIVLVAGGIAFPSGRLFWSLCFAYALFMALLLQKAILPLWPEMHAGHGLLMNDAIVFHNVAVEIAQRIQTIGWSEWRVYPPGASGNVGLLSALYALLGPDPAWFIPFNAAAHATGALLIYRIGSRLVDSDVGRLGGLLAGICFLVFPSALQWYGQNHKDAFAIAGLLLALDAWLEMHDDRFGLAQGAMLGVLLQMLLGAVLLGLVRPYYVVVLVLALLASFLTASIWRTSPGIVGTRLGSIAGLALLAAAFASVDSATGVYGGNPGESTKEYFHWQRSETVPALVDKSLRRASELRAHFVNFGRSVGAGSEVDGDRLPNSALAAIAYLPRALVVGLLAPFPDTWSERVTLPRLVGAMETACWYLAVLGGLVTVARYRSRKLLAGAVFCAILITMLAYIHPNVGTLYRQRFGLWHFFMLVGCIGWVSLMLGHLTHHSSSVLTPGLEGGAAEAPTPMASAADRLAGSGTMVILITLACYLGFFARDLLLIGQLGLGGELDAFFSAAMIPMFFVSCLAMPLGDALVLPFVAALNGAADVPVRLLRATLGLALMLLVGAMCVALVGAPWLVSWVLGNASAENQTEAVEMLRWFAPIIGLSAWTVVGNAALNSLGKSRASALGQLAVPVATLIALVLVPSGQTVAAGIGGMVVGTLGNSVIVFWRLRASGFLLLPSGSPLAVTAEVRRLYLPLVAAAILPAALIPMNYAFAASVTTGTVAAWAFASKIVVLFSGLASVGATAVVLPQLAQALVLGQAGQMRHDANMLIALGIWLGGVLTLGGFLFAEPMVAGLLGKGLAAEQIVELTGIVKVGMLQLPLAIVGALANKLAIAAGRSSRVMHSALLAFIGNILINLLLVPRLGVMGVAVGALLGSTLATVAVLAGTYRHIGLALREIFIALACWLAWLAVCVALVSNSTAALVSAVVALLGMARLQWWALRGGQTTSAAAAT